MSDFQVAINDAYQKAKETHPMLRGSVNAAYNQWVARANDSLTVRDWEKDEIGGRELVALLTKTVFASETVLEAGDVKCRMIHPVLVYADVPKAREGEKVKASLSAASAVLAVTDKQVIMIVQLGGGWMDLVDERTKFARPRFITLGGVLVSPKFWCLQVDVEDDDPMTLGIGRGFTTRTQTTIREELLAAILG